MAKQKKDKQAGEEKKNLTDAERRQQLKDSLNKEAGERLICSLKEEAMNGINVISTGVPSLDLKLGAGGIPRGRIVEIYGPNQAGKTTLALQMAANVYKAGGAIIYIDAEEALDTKYATTLGLDIYDEDRFLIIQPGYGEEAFNAIWKFINARLVDLVIVDSYPTMTPYAAISSAEEKGFEKTPAVALGARMWGYFLDKALRPIKRSDTGFVILNQERMVSGGMSMYPGRAGGNVLKHVDFTTIQLSSSQSSHKGSGDKQKGTFVGVSRQTVATITKNKMACPYQQVQFDVVFGKGISYYKDLLGLCVEYQVGAKCAGTWWTFIDANGEEIDKIQGHDAAEELLKKNPELVMNILDRLEEVTGIRFMNPHRPTDRYGIISSEPYVAEAIDYDEEEDDVVFTPERIMESIEDIDIEHFDSEPSDVIQEELDSNNSINL